MSPLQVAIVDDEPLARARLRRLLPAVGGEGLRIVAECVDAVELLAAAAEMEIDVVFLDIEMPGGDGFEALARWPGQRPRVVFVTAYAQHGVRAFDHRAVDYLMKPVSAERLADTIERLRAATGAAPDTGPTPKGLRRLALPMGQRTHLVAMDRIDLALAQGNYVEVHAAGARYLLRGTLSEFEAQLEAGRFLRIHRSVVVRIGAVSRLQPMGSGRFRIGLYDGRELTSGRHFRDQVHALLGHPP